jgi:DNA-binding beta-propeller fold protein YncE
MNGRVIFVFLGVAMLPVAALPEGSHEDPLRLIQTIPLPNVEGRIDHFAIDLPNERLFVCALGNNSVEVIDLRKDERIHSITGLGNPQGAAYLVDLEKLIIANDKGGVCNIYEGKSFALTATVDLKDDADNVRYDDLRKQVYVGYGNGGISVIDPKSGKQIRSIELSGHPEAFVLEKQGRRVFVNIPSAKQVAVINRDEGKVVAKWNTGAASANFPMAFDETHHRLFIGCRSPAQLVVLDSDSGAVLTNVPIASDPDDVFVDETQHRLLAICGGGSIAVIDQIDPNHYKTTATIATASGTRTGLFVSELKSLFVAVPKRWGQSAEIRRYVIQ